MDVWLKSKKLKQVLAKKSSCNTYTTGKTTLPEIYAQAQGPLARGHVHIFWQSTSDCGISNMYYKAYAE